MSAASCRTAPSQSKSGRGFGHRALHRLGFADSSKPTLWFNRVGRTATDRISPTIGVFLRHRASALNCLVPFYPVYCTVRCNPMATSLGTCTPLHPDGTKIGEDGGSRTRVFDGTATNRYTSFTTGHRVQERRGRLHQPPDYAPATLRFPAATFTAHQQGSCAERVRPIRRSQQPRAQRNRTEPRRRQPRPH